MLHISRTGFLLLLVLVLGLGGIVVVKLLIEGSTGRALALAAVAAVVAFLLWIQRLATIDRERQMKAGSPPDPPEHAAPQSDTASSASAAIRYGFVGLGRMGGPIAANLTKRFPLAVFDRAGTAERAPAEARIAASVAEVAASCDAIFLSLPAGPDVLAVLGEIVAAKPRRAATVIDLSTIGIAAAEEASRRAAAAGLGWLDAPVSGGRAGAIAATIAVMCAGPRALVEAHGPALAAMAKNVFHVGERAGQGQALKLLNNFLSATATAATAEALLFGRAQGLDVKTVLEVVNVSTGASAASQGKYMRNVLRGTFDSGFGADQMAKDLALYREALAAAGTAGAIGSDIAALWQNAARALGSGDHTRIFEFLAQRRKS